LHNEALHHLFCSPYIFGVITRESWTRQAASMTEVMNVRKSVLVKSRLVYEGNAAVDERRLDEIRQ
jgi:hypothetical protein